MEHDQGDLLGARTLACIRVHLSCGVEWQGRKPWRCFCQERELRLRAAKLGAPLRPKLRIAACHAPRGIDPGTHRRRRSGPIPRQSRSSTAQPRGCRNGDWAGAPNRSNASPGLLDRVQKSRNNASALRGKRMRSRSRVRQSSCTSLRRSVQEHHRVCRSRDRLAKVRVPIACSSLAR